MAHATTLGVANGRPHRSHHQAPGLLTCPQLQDVSSVRSCDRYQNASLPSSFTSANVAIANAIA